MCHGQSRECPAEPRVLSCPRLNPTDSLVAPYSATSTEGSLPLRRLLMQVAANRNSGCPRSHLGTVCHLWSAWVGHSHEGRLSLPCCPFWPLKTLPPASDLSEGLFLIFPRFFLLLPFVFLLAVTVLLFSVCTCACACCMLLVHSSLALGNSLGS